MKYRKLGSTGLEVSEIGMGLEHLLVKDQSVVTETIHAAIRGGINYLDCLSQHDFSQGSDINEDYIKLGNALKGLRDKVYMTYIANAAAPVEHTIQGFESFLKHVGTDHADVFIIACCDKLSLYETVTGNDSLLTYAQRLRDEKKIGHIGFSTHSRAIAHTTIESGFFEVLMYPVNPAFDVIADEEKFISDDLGKLWDAAYEHKPGSGQLVRKSVFGACERNRIGLVAMKPFAGGWLFKPSMNTGFTPINLVSYALAQNGVSTVIPGCTSAQEIESILEYYTCEDEKRDYSKPVSLSRWSVNGTCLYCSHCQPCAKGIDIAGINRLLDSAKESEHAYLPEGCTELGKTASSCIQCGQCEERCPFGVKIMQSLKEAANKFV